MIIRKSGMMDIRRMESGDVRRVHAVVEDFIRPFVLVGGGCCFEVDEVEVLGSEERSCVAPRRASVVP